MNKEKLKQEAEEYAKKNGNCFSKEYGIRYRTYIDCAEPKEKRIEELEQENAELRNLIMQSKKDGISPINALIIGNLVNQLTKANELLRRCYENYIHLEPLRSEIKQFLDKVKKK